MFMELRGRSNARDRLPCLQERSRDCQPLCEQSIHGAFQMKDGPISQEFDHPFAGNESNAGLHKPVQKLDGSSDSEVGNSDGD